MVQNVTGLVCQYLCMDFLASYFVNEKTLFHWMATLDGYSPKCIAHVFIHLVTSFCQTVTKLTETHNFYFPITDLVNLGEA